MLIQELDDRGVLLIAFSADIDDDGCSKFLEPGEDLL